MLSATSDDNKESEWLELLPPQTSCITPNIAQISGSLWYSTESSDSNKGAKGMVEYDLHQNETRNTVQYPADITPFCHSCCPYKDKIYIIEGYTHGHIILFDPSTRQFTLKHEIPKIGSCPSTLLIDDDIHIFHGSLNDNKHFIYSVIHNTVHQVSDPVATHRMHSVSVLQYRNRILRFGGQDNSSIDPIFGVGIQLRIAQQSYRKQFWMSSVMDAKKKNSARKLKWTLLKKCKLPNKGMTVRGGFVVWKHYLIIFGGCTELPKGHTDKIYVLNLDACDGWTELTHIKCPLPSEYVAKLTGDGMVHLLCRSSKEKHFAVSIHAILAERFIALHHEIIEQLQTFGYQQPKILRALNNVSDTSDINAVKDYLDHQNSMADWDAVANNTVQLTYGELFEVCKLGKLIDNFVAHGWGDKYENVRIDVLEKLSDDDFADMGFKKGHIYKFRSFCLSLEVKSLSPKQHEADNDEKSAYNLPHSNASHGHINVRNPLVLLIGISEYEHKDNLPGTLVDMQNYRDLWRNKYNYDVLPAKDDDVWYNKKQWSFEDVEDFVRQKRKKLVDDDDSLLYDALIVMINGHGSQQGILPSEWSLKEKHAVNITGLQDLVSTTWQKQMKGIPRIFVIDACRGGLGSGAVDMAAQSPRGSLVKHLSSLLCTVWGNSPGIQVKESATDGGYFSQCFKKELGKTVDSNATLLDITIQTGDALGAMTHKAQMCWLEGDPKCNKVVFVKKQQ